MEIMSDNKVVNFQPESVATFTGIYIILSNVNGLIKLYQFRSLRSVPV